MSPAIHGIIVLAWLVVPLLALRTDHSSPIESVVVQWDSRDPLPKEHQILTTYNERYYNSLPGHKYVFFDRRSLEDEAEPVEEFGTAKEDIEDCAGSAQSHENIRGPNGCTLFAAWGKVKAMVKATEMYPQAKYFLYLDSDAVANFKYNRTGFTVSDLHSALSARNGENTFYVPAAPWNLEVMMKDTSYTEAINSGVLVWKGGRAASEALKLWWKSALDDYNSGVAAAAGFKPPFRSLWPWEQNRLDAIMNEPAYRSTGKLFSSIPPSVRYHYKEGMEEACYEFANFVSEKPYCFHYACPILHYTGVGGMAKNEITGDIGNIGATLADKKKPYMELDEKQLEQMADDLRAMQEASASWKGLPVVPQG